MLNATFSVELERIIKEDENLVIVPSDVKNDGKKIPYYKWRQIAKPFHVVSLFDMLDKVGNDTIAFVCGSVSGNLICIDIDNKFNDGFSSIIFKDIKEFYPEIWEKVRIEKTISGGYHILYKIELQGNECPSFNGALAYCEKPGSEGKFQGFLEIKANGGICQSYPTRGYSVVREGEYGRIPVISWSQHCEIEMLCKSYDEKPKSEIHFVKATSFQSDYYESGHNPFEDFDNSDDGGRVLEEFGWRLRDKNVNGKYPAWIKPGKDSKSNDVGAIFHPASNERYFKIYTTSFSELGQESFRPCGILLALKFNNDKKRLYEYLVSKGYGQINRGREQKIIKRAASSELRLLPANISEEGKKEFEEEVVRINKKHPHGIFWINKIDKKGELNGEIEISQKGIDNVVIKMGYKYFNNKIYVIDFGGGGYLLKTVNEGELFHSLLMYIDNGNDEESRKIYDEYSRHIKTYGELTISRLKEFGKIDNDKVISSTKYISYKFYKNCYLKIDKENIEELKYQDIVEEFVFEDNIINRDFILVNGEDLDDGEDLKKKSKYYEFLKRSVGISNHLYEIIGYLTHDFIDDSMNALIIASESTNEFKKGGGAGKNIFFNLLNHVTSVHVVDGSQAELNNTLLQAFDFQRILVLSDVEERFNYAFFKNFSAGSASLKKLYHDIIILKRKQMPKPVVLTNFSYEIVAGLERRIIPLEFTDFFSKIRGGVQTYFKGMFPSFERDDLGDWDKFDWNCFDTIIIESIQKFLSVGQLVPIELSRSGWEKQFIQVYKEPTFLFIEENISVWCSENDGKLDTRAFDNSYNKFLNDYGSGDKYKLSPMRMNKALQDYCNCMKIKFEKNQTWSFNGISIKGRIFGSMNVVKVDDGVVVPF